MKPINICFVSMCGAIFLMCLIMYQAVDVLVPSYVLQRSELIDNLNKSEILSAIEHNDVTGKIPLEIPGSNLYERVRILCWVMTSPTNLHTKAIHVNATWGRHCNKLLFMSSVDNKNFPAIGLNTEEGRDHLYDKTRKAFQYIWKNHFSDADWFLKADDDTYVIVENLRYMLKDYMPERPLYFGRKFKPFVKQGYMSGGAGYVLSKEALRRYITALENKTCIPQSSIEDVEIGKCLNNIDVEAVDTRDKSKKERFFPFDPQAHLGRGHIPPDMWFWKYIYYPTTTGLSCCSDYVITFHYVSPDMMYVLEFFSYRLKVFGRKPGNQSFSLATPPIFVENGNMSSNSANRTDQDT